MTEVKYTRVNVSTNTSTPRYNEFDERYGEIDMQLPSNLISNVEKVKAVEMAVMKMAVPLAQLPALSLPLTPWTNGNLLSTRGIVSIFPFEYDRDGQLVGPPSGIFRSSIIPVVLSTPAAHALEIGDVTKAQQMEISRGYHDFGSIAEFLNALSTAVMRCVDYNINLNTTEKHVADIEFVCKSDNTLELNYTPRYPPDITGNSTAIARIAPFGFSGSVEHFTTISTPEYVKPDPISNMRSSTNKTYGYYFIVSKRIADTLPSLPWIKVNNAILPDNIRQTYWSSFLQQMDPGAEDVFYILDTKQATLEIQSNFLTCSNPTFGTYHCDCLSYDFPFSDAISITNIQSIVLTMNGTSVNQQVYPINIRQGSVVKAGSQTTTVPVIEVYYPFWNRPSDLTTVMVISREVFSSAAPIKIDKSVLKERTIKFKLYYITSEGDMREMMIPRGVPFNFQICFALYY